MDKIKGGFVQNNELVKLLNFDCCGISKEQYDEFMKNIPTDNGKEFNFSELINIDFVDYLNLSEEFIKKILKTGVNNGKSI